MNKVIKLTILIVLSLSVNFIYEKTCNKTYNLTSIGDKLSLGTDSYNIKNYSYIDYYAEHLRRTKETIIVNNSFSNDKQTIKGVLNSLKQPELKRTLIDTDLLIITLGYNDLLEGLALLENKNNYKFVIKEIETDYNELIEEIRKYYHEEIIVIGYFQSNTDDYYINKGIKDLNKILKRQKVTYIDTYNLLKKRQKYFSNPNSYYPNYKGYQRIYEEITRKHLQNNE